MQQESGANAKQQIIGRIKQSTNILVTVSNNPSVDSLSAALGLSLMLNKLDKHATAVFSGAIPPAINFLEPTKTFEHDIDGLRDFIVALDKEKADRLRYKVDDDVVKIFITPYKTTITEKDLQFSQGDFNVDLIIGLGVEKRDELDAAIVAHGRILHDATIVTINTDEQKGSLGSVDWKDSKASSLSEMLVALGGALKPEKANIFDQQISTALLTGIVAATERFSNGKTSSRVMTTAAQLMASGANQQLIANNLQVVNKPIQSKIANDGSDLKRIPDDSAKVEPVNIQKADGEMHVSHEDDVPKESNISVPEELKPIAMPEMNVNEEVSDKGAGFNSALQDQSNDKKINSTQKQSNTINQEKPAKSSGDNYIRSKPSWMGRNVKPPSLGGTLNATTEEALATKKKQEDDERNRALFTHGAPVESKSTAPIPTATTTISEPVAVEPPVKEETPLMNSVKLNTEPTIEQLENEVKSKSTSDVDAARAAVHEALNINPNDSSSVATGAEQSVPATYQPAQQQIGEVTNSLPLPPVPPLPDYNSLPPEPSVAAVPQTQEPEPPSSASVVPPLPQTQQAEQGPVQDVGQQQNPSDPGQFRIPGA